MEGFSNNSARKNHTPKSRAELATIFLCRQKTRVKPSKKKQSGNVSIFLTNSNNTLNHQLESIFK